MQFPQLLRSIALNYILRSSLNPPKALSKALNCLKKRDVIVITKPGKGSGVVVMDKTEYIRLLSATSVDNTSKFIHVDDRRSPKHYHALLALRYTLRGYKFAISYSALVLLAAITACWTSHARMTATRIRK